MASNESLSDVTLRQWPTQKKERQDQQDILFQIHQLTSERGHLRNITEASLQEDIKLGRDITTDAAKKAEKAEKDEQAPSEQEIREKIFNAQKEMYGHLEWAKFAAENALDLLSLVLSQDPNKRNPSSFSHTFRDVGLNQGVPLGSFGVTRENHEHHVRKPDEAQRLQEYKDKQETAAKGSRMEALDVAADEILQAAKQLEKEVRRETKYWQEIISVSDKGWPIQRLRQNARHVPFAVRYGLPEASDHFKARGFAPLNMDRDGSIILDSALRSKPKSFRVRIIADGKIVGTSQLSVVAGLDTNDLSIEKSIQQSRNSLFEEELFHEMSLESRHLLAYGVEFRDGVLRVDTRQTGDMSKDRKLLIDCVPRETSVPTQQGHSDDWLAETISETLHLLLIHEHNMRWFRRSQLPLPLSGRIREKQPPPLLRTLLALFRHLEGVDSLHVYLEVAVKTLKSAGLPFDVETTREVSWAKLAESLKDPSKQQGLSATERLLDGLTKPFNGKATISLPSQSGAQSETLTIDTRTIIGQPTFGTEHKLTISPSLMADTGSYQQLKFSNVREVKSYLDWALTAHIIHRVLMNEYEKRMLVKGTGPRFSIVGRGSAKNAITSKNLTVELRQGKLYASAVDVESQQELSDAELAFTWDGHGAESLLNTIGSWVEH